MSLFDKQKLIFTVNSLNNMYGINERDIILNCLDSLNRNVYSITGYNVPDLGQEMYRMELNDLKNKLFKGYVNKIKQTRYDLTDLIINDLYSTYQPRLADTYTVFMSNTYYGGDNGNEGPSDDSGASWKGPPDSRKWLQHQGKSDKDGPTRGTSNVPAVRNLKTGSAPVGAPSMSAKFVGGPVSVSSRISRKRGPRTLISSVGSSKVSKNLSTRTNVEKISEDLNEPDEEEPSVNEPMGPPPSVPSRSLSPQATRPTGTRGAELQVHLPFYRHRLIRPNIVPLVGIVLPKANVSHYTDKFSRNTNADLDTNALARSRRKIYLELLMKNLLDIRFVSYLDDEEKEQLLIIIDSKNEPIDNVHFENSPNMYAYSGGIYRELIKNLLSTPDEKFKSSHYKTNTDKIVNSFRKKYVEQISLLAGMQDFDAQMAKLNLTLSNSNKWEYHAIRIAFLFKIVNDYIIINPNLLLNGIIDYMLMDLVNYNKGL